MNQGYQPQQEPYPPHGGVVPMQPYQQAPQAVPSQGPLARPPGLVSKDSIFAILDEMVAAGYDLDKIDNDEIAQRQRQRHNGYSDNKPTISSYKAQYKKQLIHPSLADPDGIERDKTYYIVKATKFLEKAKAKWGLSLQDIRSILDALDDDE